MKIVISGSVLFSNPGWAGSHGPCSGDDWDCYNAEQRWLVNLLMESGDENEGRSPIVITGDYHFSDIREGEKERFTKLFETLYVVCSADVNIS